jgi:hypothetical protein
MVLPASRLLKLFERNKDATAEIATASEQPQPVG